jgi:hypothetical protein
MSDRRIRISAEGMGLVSFDPLGLKAENFNIYIPQNFLEPKGKLKITIETKSGEKTIEINDLINTLEDKGI